MVAPFSRLRNQSQVIVILTVGSAGSYVGTRVFTPASRAALLTALCFSVALAAVVLAARAATVSAALIGALLALSYGSIPGAAHTPLWILTAALVMTLGASRVGRERKRAQGTAEHKRGRTASQVAANLCAGALSGWLFGRYGAVVTFTVLVACLAEVTADTLGSELGQLAKTPPRMLLTWRVAPPGTDGAVSVPGTVAAVVGAGVVSLLGMWLLPLPWWAAVIAGGAGVTGMFVDSVLGQLLELRSLLNNDAVNFLSTLVAAALAFVAVKGRG